MSGRGLSEDDHGVRPEEITWGDHKGPDHWSYGPDANRATLAIFLRHHHRDVLSSRK